MEYCHICGHALEIACGRRGDAVEYQPIERCEYKAHRVHYQQLRPRFTACTSEARAVCIYGVTMSVKIMSRVWEKSNQNGSALLLLLALADWSNDDGVSWYGLKRLYKKMRMSERNTQRLISELCMTNELFVLQGGNATYHTNVYFVTTSMDQAELSAALSEYGRIEFDQADMSAKAILSKGCNLGGVQKRVKKLTSNVTQYVIKNDPLSLESGIEDETYEAPKKPKLPKAYGDLYVSVWRNIYAAEDTKSVRNIAGKDAKLLLADYPNIDASEFDDFLVKYKEHQPGMSYPRHENLSEWFGTYRREWRKVMFAPKVQYVPVEPEYYVAPSAAGSIKR